MILLLLNRHRYRFERLLKMWKMLRTPMFLWLLQIISLKSDSNGYATSGGCHFPKNWWGSWFQSGLGDIAITETLISNKGYCFENQRDYYLVENRQDGCHQCLLVISRHPNLIQYKESYCIGPEEMSSLCGKIRVEAVLYTLVRDVSRAIPFPFEDAFQFFYNNNSGGFCREPTSYVHQCASKTKFHFRFRRCENAAYTFDRDLHLECLASWKDGSDMYFYGQFLSDESVSKEDRYRCFMYVEYGTLVYLSMSADATCRGLRSPKDGPLVMELTGDSHGWPSAQCEFPRWFNASSPWSDLSGKHHYSLHDDGWLGSEMILNYYRQTSNGQHILGSFKCMRTISGQVSGEQDAILMLTHVLDDCHPRYQCLRLQRRHFYVVQLQKGDYIMDPNHRCSSSDFTDQHSNQLLVSQHPRAGSCPFEGKYGSLPDAAGCQLEVSAGCESKSRMDITSSCQAYPVLRLSCLLWWNEQQTLFFLARLHPNNDSDQIMCYVLSSVRNATEIVQDRRCSHGLLSNSAAGQSEKYRFSNYLDECPVETIYSEVARGQMIIDQNEYIPENGYRYVISGEMSNLDQLLPVQTPADPSGQSSISAQSSTSSGKSFGLATVLLSLILQCHGHDGLSIR